MEISTVKPLSLGMLDLPFVTWEWDVVENRLTGDEQWDSALGTLSFEAAQPGIGWAALMEPSRSQSFHERLMRHFSVQDRVHFHLILRESTDQVVELILHGMVAERAADNSPLRVIGLCRHMFDQEAFPALGSDLGRQNMVERRKLEALLIKAQRFEGIGKLAGGIAHDLNNLLAPIRMAAELLERKLNQPELSKYLDIIQTSTERARKVISQILMFSRGADTEQIDNIRPMDVLRDLEHITRETFPKRIELNFLYDGELPTVHIDATRLHQALLNLLINARDAISATGSITVLCAVQEFTLHMKVGNHSLVPGKYLRIDVSDTGSGIPKDIRNHIFDPFFTTKPKGQGTGLGLASAYGIIAGAGGFIDLESQMGKGSKFSVFLPESGIDIHPDEEDEEETTFTALKGRTVLLIDDEENIIRTLEPLLVEMGMLVMAFTDAEVARAYARLNPAKFDIAMIDLRMPRFSGEDLIRELMGFGCICRFILMTGELEQPSANPRKFDESVVACIRKPFEVKELHRTLVGCIEAQGRL